MSDVIKAAAIVAFGATEGYAFFRTGLVAPSAIIDQMSFSSMLVLKLFMSGVGSSMLAQGLMDVFHPQKFAASRVMSKMNAGFPRAVAGCFALGVGMTLCGSGPTITPAQIGSQSQNTLWILAGALSGATAFNFFEKQFLRTDVCSKGGEKLTLDAKLGVRYYKLALPVGAALMACAIALDYLWPHSWDVERLGTHLQAPWSPVLAGAVIGLNQLPLRYLASRGQGGSTSYMNCLSAVTGQTIAGRFAMSNVNVAAQFLYVWVGTTLGAYFALQQQQSTYVPAVGPDPARAFLGGFMALFGARFAAGCTCGHGITGSAELSVQSLAAAASIFIGGMAAALVVPPLKTPQ